MTKWQPIEVAPKDGTKIQVWGRCYEWPEVVFYEEYAHELKKELGEEGYWRYAEEMLADVYEVSVKEMSHWMPLPNPPTE